MRIAISAMAALSGLFLLGVALYGQPAEYLREAREQWDALVGEEPDQPVNLDAVARRVARLQTEGRRFAGESRIAGLAEAPRPATIDPRADRSLTDPSGVLSPEATRAPHPTHPEAGSPVGRPNTQQLAKEPPAPLVGAPETSDLPPAVAVPDRHEFAADEPAGPQGRSQPEASKPGEPAKPDPTRQQSPSKLASTKPAAVPPPAQPQSARPDTDDAQSVLARLRQVAPAPAPSQQAALSLPQAAPPQQSSVPPLAEPPRPPRPAQSPSVPRLTSARAALAAGRVENARRSLQEAQLQLVFRPVDTFGDDMSSAAKAAADVAHALDALSANDVPLSRRYVDAAIDDLSGSGASQPVQETQQHGNGYAPAYPPR